MSAVKGERLRRIGDLVSLEMPSHIGWLRLRASSRALVEISKIREPANREAGGRDKLGSKLEIAPQLKILKQMQRQLLEYFDGRRTSFSPPSLATSGTEFQQQVWRCLRSIPYGQSMTYGEVAQAIGRPGASRAVGSACGKNPWLILVPCHRVRASNGPGGFACGMATKSKLLSIENATG